MNDSIPGPAPQPCTLAHTLLLAMDAWRFLCLCLRPSLALAAENLFLRKQPALFQERQIKPRRATQATRMALAWLARWFDWHQALVLVDRDAIFSRDLDQRVRHLGLRVLKTPPQSPQANALCERLLGTLRRECLDFMMPLGEHHLRRLLSEWGWHYHAGRPHMSLGPGIPEPPSSLPASRQKHRHRLAAHLCVVSKPIPGGLHHDYRLEKKAA